MTLDSETAKHAACGKCGSADQTLTTVIPDHRWGYPARAVGWCFTCNEHTFWSNTDGIAIHQVYYHYGDVWCACGEGPVSGVQDQWYCHNGPNGEQMRILFDQATLVLAG